jgi:predicted short-subunit dehydrogenase-like oxidoreductase (DUF2520 family)
MTFTSACVVGAGRVGKALAARLGERIPTRSITRELELGDADLVVLCVPDRAISEVARAIPAGPWIAHTSGASRLDVLAPHERRFSLHPLQTFTLARGPEQFDGAWGAISGSSPEAIAAARELGGLLGVKPFEVRDEDRPLYHAAASFASAFLVTLHDIAAGLMEAAGAPPQALEPLILRTVENGFQHTGPLVRDDWETVRRHGEEISARDPALLPLYTNLVKTEAELLGTEPR